MDEISLEDATKAGLAVADWALPKIKEIIRSKPDKDRIELILNKLIENNYKFSEEINDLLKDNYGFYENSWGKVLKELTIYKNRCQDIINLCKRRGWIKINPKARCKVKISKITKLDDARWGFTTIRRTMDGFKKQKSIPGVNCDIYTSPSIPEGDVLVLLEELEDECIFGVFKWVELIK